MYRAAQWTTFAFGIIATTLGIAFFRGVGVVGHRAPKPASASDNEKGERVDVQEDEDEDEKSAPLEGSVRKDDVTGTSTRVSSSAEKVDKLGV